jgi:hypothetical protein
MFVELTIHPVREIRDDASPEAEAASKVQAETPRQTEAETASETVCGLEKTTEAEIKGETKAEEEIKEIFNVQCLAPSLFVIHTHLTAPL